ncbi:hypothetical protein, partial [Enterococcus faecium]|uniref:hypothetical protein n=1 Tax=Enterococcus faecium TaxID=1352 RepID=UPI003D0A77E2
NAKHCAFDEVELLHKIVDLTESLGLFFSFYSKVILVLSFNTKILFLNKKYSFFTIIEKKR